MLEETEFKPRNYHPSNVRRSRGKMHGQFASAGWNKWRCNSQSVNNQETTKKTTGRAKKRQQYNHQEPEKSPEILVEEIEDKQYSRELSHNKAVERRTWYNSNYTYREPVNTKKPNNIEYRNANALHDNSNTEDFEEWTVIQRNNHYYHSRQHK